MELIDTHAHLYLPEFDHDREAMVQRALDTGVSRVFMPNIDMDSVEPMMRLAASFPGHCLPMMGLHPGSVDAGYFEQLNKIKSLALKEQICAIGETGIDLYRDTTYREEQLDAFSTQLCWAKELALPVVIHIRNSFSEVFDVLKKEWVPGLRGIFHCFSGNTAQALRAIEMGFFLGIGGVITFRNSGLQEVVRKTSLDHIVLETDAPYLAPVPYRGKRNESAYISLVAGTVAEIKDIPAEGVANHTTDNAMKLFSLNG